MKNSFEKCDKTYKKSLEKCERSKQMTEEIKDELENTYEFLIFEIEYIELKTYKIYVSISLTDYKNNDKIKAIEFNFKWDDRGTKESNLNQMKYKINKAILKFFMKEGE